MRRKKQVLALADVDAVKAVQYGITALTGTGYQRQESIAGLRLTQTPLF